MSCSARAGCSHRRHHRIVLALAKVEVVLRALLLLPVSQVLHVYLDCPCLTMPVDILMSVGVVGMETGSEKVCRCEAFWNLGGADTSGD